MEQKQIKILHQSLKTKWYRMIETGEKTEEYREHGPYWCQRIQPSPCPQYTHVQFSLGYPKKNDATRRMTFELKAIEYREGREEWGAEKGKKYLVEVLGRRTTLDGTKLLED